VIDRDSDRAYHRQVADVIRGKIASGEYEPGGRLPSRRKLAEEHGCSVDTIRAAVRELAHEGLLIALPREGTEVTGPGPRGVVYERAPVRISTRMPSEPERRERGYPPGVPLIVIEQPVHSEDDPAAIREYPGHTTTVEITG
jgi:DNA-binding transcriptional regulator YhcF (GntR family)